MWSHGGGLPAFEERCSHCQHLRWPRRLGLQFRDLPRAAARRIAASADDAWAEAYGPGTGHERRPSADAVPGVGPHFVKRPWTCVWRHQWRRAEHINVLEGISLVRAAERVSESQGRLGRQHLILTDSQVVLGVVQKGRSSVPRLNRFARRLAALTLGYRQHFLFRWISTKINPADGPSRSFG